MSRVTDHDRRHTQIKASFIADGLRQMHSAPHYQKWLFSLLRPYLGPRVLEVGAGIGSITELLLANGDSVLGMEPNAACRAEWERRFSGHTRARCLASRIEDCPAEPIEAFRATTVVCVNVLEHIEDDATAMQRFREWLPEGGRVLLIVPAVPAAYGAVDAAVGHFRRYSKTALRRLLIQTGHKIARLQYFNVLGLFGWCYNTWLHHSVQLSDTQIRAFNAIVPWYAVVDRLLPIPLGMSLLAVTEVDGREAQEGGLQPTSA